MRWCAPRSGTEPRTPGPSPEPDKEISTIRLFRGCGLRSRSMRAARRGDRRPFPLPTGVGVTRGPTSKRRPWFPPVAHTHTGRLCSAGSGRHPAAPTSTLVRSPPTPPFPSAAAPVSPCRRSTSAWMLLLCGTTCVASAGRARIHERAARRRVMTGSPSLRCLPRRNVGLPGAWTVLLLRAVVVHPAGCGSPSP